MWGKLVMTNGMIKFTSAFILSDARMPGQTAAGLKTLLTCIYGQVFSTH